MLALFSVLRYDIALFLEKFVEPVDAHPLAIDLAARSAQNVVDRAVERLQQRGHRFEYLLIDVVDSVDLDFVIRAPLGILGAKAQLFLRLALDDDVVDAVACLRRLGHQLTVVDALAHLLRKHDVRKVGVFVGLLERLRNDKIGLRDLVARQTIHLRPHCVSDLLHDGILAQRLARQGNHAVQALFVQVAQEQAVVSALQFHPLVVVLAVLLVGALVGARDVPLLLEQNVRVAGLLHLEHLFAPRPKRDVSDVCRRLRAKREALFHAVHRGGAVRKLDHDRVRVVHADAVRVELLDAGDRKVVDVDGNTQLLFLHGDHDDAVVARCFPYGEHAHSGDAHIHVYPGNGRQCTKPQRGARVSHG